jgi:hypothetical protein
MVSGGTVYITNSHDDKLKHSSNIIGYYLNFRGYNVRITNERRLSCIPLTWPQVA